MARILIVDDNPSARALLVCQLEHEGYVTIECDNGADGLKLAELLKPDLVITDATMPGMSGTQFIAGLRNLPQTVRTPILFHTAAGDEREVREAAAAYGVAGILTKPCRAKVVLAEIASALNASLQEPPPGIAESPAGIDVALRARVPEYVTSCERDAAAIESALAANDLTRVEGLGHNLKGTGSAYGFSRITGIGGRLEAAAKSGDRTEVAGQLRDLVNYLASVNVTSAAAPARPKTCGRGLNAVP